LTDLDILQARNNYLLRLDEDLLPVMPADSIVTSFIMDTSNQVHPLQEYWQSRQAVYSAEIKNEKTARLPELSVGYNNLSIVGWQSPDGISQKYYGSGDRFSTFNLGMGVPLFNGAVKARAQAGEVNMEVARMNEQHATESIRNRKTQLLSEYRKYGRSIEHYRTTGIVQSDQIIRQSMMAFRAGDISYMEWINLMNQAVGIRMTYLDALLALRVASAELEYLNGN
jgi:heavy metal efflux system protein